MPYRRVGGVGVSACGLVFSGEAEIQDSLGDALGMAFPSDHALKVRLNLTLAPDIAFM